MIRDDPLHLRNVHTMCNNYSVYIISIIIILVRLFVCLSVCPDDHARVRSPWRFRFDTGAAWGGGQVEFA